MTKEDIKFVQSKFLHLGANGVGLGSTLEGMTMTERRQALDKDAQWLLEYSPILSLICVWCSFVGRRGTANARHGGSYGLKHTVEYQFGHYVGNGEMIAAAVFCGIQHYFPYRNEWSINLDLAISSKMFKRHGMSNKVITPKIPGEPREWWSLIHNSTGESLWRGVIAAPLDTLPLLVLADWVEEQGAKPWSDWLRGVAKLQEAPVFIPRGRHLTTADVLAGVKP